MRYRGRVRLLRSRTSARRRSISRVWRAWREAARATARHSRDVLDVQLRRIARLTRTAAKGGVLVVALSLLLASGAFAASTLYGQYGGNRAGPNASSWAERPIVYFPTACRQCHPAHVGVQASGPHQNVRCEACHGPLDGHPGSDAPARVLLPKPGSDICGTCHVQTPGRPVAFPQVDPSNHYRAAACVRCHDPHAILAVAPPDVTHPLESLPGCTTCHAPDGLRKVPAGHELIADDECLTCHAVANGER